MLKKLLSDVKIKDLATKMDNRLWLKGRFIYHIVRRMYLTLDNPSLVKPIFDLDWNNLLILDACRYDLFNYFIKKYFSKECDYIISRGTETPEFLVNNFLKVNNKYKFNDIIYITANPWVDIICKNKFFKLVSVWKYYWDDELGTVHPYYINKISLNIIKQYPNKKIIVHYLQPHNPYLGVDYINTLSYDDQPRKNPKGKILTKPFKAVELGKIPTEKLKEAYSYNLKIVLFYALYLSYKLEGKTIITADHGEAFGEKIHPLIPIRIYGHPPGVRIPVLVRVPWFVVNNDIKNKIDIKELKKEIYRLRPKNEKLILREKINKLKNVIKNTTKKT